MRPKSTSYWLLKKAAATLRTKCKFSFTALLNLIHFYIYLFIVNITLLFLTNRDLYRVMKESERKKYMKQFYELIRSNGFNGYQY